MKHPEPKSFMGVVCLWCGGDAKGEYGKQLVNCGASWRSHADYCIFRKNYINRKGKLMKIQPKGER